MVNASEQQCGKADAGQKKYMKQQYKIGNKNVFEYSVFVFFAYTHLTFLNNEVLYWSRARVLPGPVERTASSLAIR